jgi:6-phosphofructokinase 2
MHRIVTVTLNPSVDVSAGVSHVVADRKLRCDGVRREPGGGGLNVSRAVAELGGSSLAVYTTGGMTGSILDALLKSVGAITRHPVQIEGWTRESFVVLERVTNRQFRFGLPGPVLEDGDWRRCLDLATSVLRPGDLLVLSGSLPSGVPEDLPVEAAAAARTREAQLVVDTSGAALRAAARSGAYLLKPNVGVLAWLAGQEHLDEDGQEQAAKAIVESGGCENLVVSLGAAGVLLVSVDGTLERIAAPDVPVRSRVGAGDSTVAGVVLGLARGWEVRDAVRFGVAAGSAAVMSEGTGLCRREDTERLYQRVRRH